MKKRSSLLSRLITSWLLAAMFASLGPEALASIIDAKPVFSTTNQSEWSAGNADIFELSKTLASGNWDLSGHIGGVNSTWVGRYGAELSAHTSGSFGLGLDAVLNAGSVDATVPMTVSLQLPDDYKINPGEHFKVNSSVGLGLDASLKSTSPTGSLRVFGDLKVEADVGGRVCVVGCVGGSATLINANLHKDLLNVGTSDLKFQYDGKAGSIDGHFPSLNLAGTVQNGAIHASGRDNVLNASADVVSMLGMAAGLPPLSGSIDLAIGKLSYDLIRGALDASVGITQDLTLVPSLMVDLALSTGEHRLFKAGESVDVTMPVSGKLEITPTYILHALFENKTGIVGQADLDLSALSVGFSRIGSIGPLFHKDIGLGSVSATLFDRQFDLGGFAAVSGAPISLSAVPEPLTMILAGFGLIAISLLRRYQTAV